MYLLILVLPVFGFISAALFGRKIGSKGSSIVTTSCLALCCLISFFSFYEVALVGCCTYIKLITWIDSETLNIDWGFLFDSCLLYTSPSPRDLSTSRMPSSA